MNTIKSPGLFSLNHKYIFMTGLLLLALTVLTVISGCNSITISVKNPPLPTAKGECVVLIHGMGRTLHSMDELQDSLVAAGYDTVNLGYPSTKKSIEAIAAENFPKALGKCQQFHPSTIHFVSHSLGGIILRKVFKEYKPKNMGKVVMLSPPNHGSAAADTLKNWWLYKMLNGPAGQQLTTDAGSLPNTLGPVDYPVGIITGDQYYIFDYWLAEMIPGPNDGKVSITSARLDGMRDFMVVHETHPFIMDAKYVQNEVIYFLQHGRFKEQQKNIIPDLDQDWLSFPSAKN